MPDSVSRRFWTADEDALVRARYPQEPTARLAVDLTRSVRSVYQHALKLALKKSAAYLASPEACRLRKGDGRGGSTRFPTGYATWNKGLRRPGWGPGRMKATQFAKGHGRTGIAATVWKPIGTERITKDGYRERKVNNDLPLKGRWRLVHLEEWEAANGPLPKGHALTFRNGDKADIRLDNLALVTRAALMQRNSVHNYPPALASAIQLLGALNRQLRTRGTNASEKQD